MRQMKLLLITFIEKEKNLWTEMVKGTKFRITARKMNMMKRSLLFPED